MTQPQPATAFASDTTALIYVVLAVFRPDPAHLAAQLRSIAAQSHDRLHLVAVIADQHSGPLLAQEATAAGLAHTLVPCDQDLDSVRAFEAGLLAVQALLEAQPALSSPQQAAPLIALSDQDDIWHPDKLARGLQTLRDPQVQLVHSDARLVEADGQTPRHASMFRYEKRLRNPGLRGLLYRNNITGMTALMRASLLEHALPFPPQSGVHYYHDLWLGLVAAATGRIALLDTPLVDYRQHGGNVIGAEDRRNSDRPRRRLRDLDMAWMRREAAAYGLARYLAQTLVHRLQDSQPRRALAPLKPFLHHRLPGTLRHLWDMTGLLLRGHIGLARIAASFALTSLGRSVWALKLALGSELNGALKRFDTRLYGLSPGMLPPSTIDAADLTKAEDYTAHLDPRKTASWQPDFNAEAAAAGPALGVLVPTLNPGEIFAGIATALDIGLGLAAQGHRVRFIATDLPMASAAVSQHFLRQRAQKAGLSLEAMDRVSLQCGQTGRHLAAHRDDRFLATAWWSAHVARGLIRRHGYSTAQILYLIQDFEPNFYAWSPEYADARASYDFDVLPIFNTTLLRDYMAQQGIACARPEALAFRPAIDIAHFATPPRPDRPAGPRRLALYGRPEVARNMYATALEALARFIEAENLGPEDIALVSVGLRHAPVTLPNGLVLQSQGKLAWEDYPDFLRRTDLGLSLMYSPHPSHPPLEMAAAGVHVVTNPFGPKDLSQLSPALHSAEATGPALAEALSAAWHAAPLTPQERHYSLAPLGMEMAEMLAALSDQLGPQTR